MNKVRNETKVLEIIGSWIWEHIHDIGHDTDLGLLYGDDADVRYLSVSMSVMIISQALNIINRSCSTLQSSVSTAITNTASINSNTHNTNNMLGWNNRKY